MSTDYTQHAYTDRVCLACKWNFAEDSWLNEWSSGNVVRVHDITDLDGLKSREIAVAAYGWEPAPKTSGQLEASIAVAVRVALTVPKRVLKDEDAASLGKVIEQLTRVVYTKETYYLKRPEFFDRPLIKRVEGVRPVDLIPVENKSKVSLVQWLYIDCRAGINAQTWELTV